jgi:cytochrome c oxidase subunit III
LTEHAKDVAHQFDDAEQQHTAATVAMWVFLATEVMFFGGLFTGYMVYRGEYSQAWAEGSQHLCFFYGTLNTAVLLVSSLTMVLAVRSAQLGLRSQILFLSLTILLGLGFLGIKGIEYHEHFVNHEFPGASFQWDGPLKANAQLFFSFYWAMTGLHAVHMVVGIGLVAYLIIKAAQRLYSPAYLNPVDIVGLYWHFVDIIWIWLYPLLYLVDRHQ